MSLLRNLITALLTAAACSAWGQELRFQHVGVQDGLSSPVVNCILEDRAGVIWIGTDRGLDRFDGQRVDPAADTAWPAGRTITALAESVDGSLWIATAEAGLGRFDPATGKMVVHDRTSAGKKAWPSDQINHVLVIDEASLLVSTRDAGAFVFTPSTGTCVPVRTGFTLDPLTGDTLWQSGTRWVIGATRLDEQRAWLAMTNDKRAPVVDLRTGLLLDEWRSISRDTVSIFSNGLVVGDTLYAGSWGAGLHAFPLRDPALPRYRAFAEQVTALAPWGAGGLVMGTEHDGLLLHSASGRITRVRRDRHDGRSVCSDHIRCLLTDRTGNLWVGTNSGVSVHAPAVHRNHEVDLLNGAWASLAEPYIHDLSEEPDGRVRIASSGGFLLVSPGDGAVAHIPVAQGGRALEPTLLIRMPDGQAFIGTESGVFRYDVAQERVVDHSTLPADRSHYMAHGMFQVRGILRWGEAGHERVLVNALGYTPRMWNPMNGTSTVPRGQEGVWAMVQGTVSDTEGNCLFATSKGILRIPHDRDTVYTQPGMGAKDFSGVFMVGSAVWAATRLSALTPLDGGQEVAPPAHLADEFVGAVADHKGDIWCATVSGLLRYRPSADAWLRVPLAPGASSARITAAPRVLHDQRIALCAGSILHLIEPASLDDLAALPEPRLHAANGSRMNGESVPATIRLSYRAATLDVVLSALQPTGAAPLQFVYRMIGVDLAPRITEGRTPLHYTGLPPGEHELLVQVRDGYGRTGPERTVLIVRVAAPFWVSWWFYALLAAGAVLLSVLWSQYRQRQLMAVQSMRDRIASDLHDEVGSALSSITIGSKLAQRMTGPDNAKLERLLQRMGETSDASLRNISDIVWTIDPKNDEGDALLDRMHTIAVELLEHQGIEVRWTVTGDVAGMKLPMDIRKDLLLIFKEAMHNISKHAAARSVQVEVARDHDHLVLRIADDGKGFDAGLTGTGHGLGSMQQRAANIRAKWSLTSAPGQGTRMEVRMPLARTRQG